MTDYWIKLYTEILDDPKVATMPDRLWRRMVELFLMTGKINGVNKSGELPEARHIAWMLRVPVDEIELDLVQLANVGIIEKVPGGWLVVNFAKRQGPVPPARRMQESRGRKQKEQYYGTELVTNRNTETDTDTEEIKNNNESAKPFLTSNIYKLYTANIGFLQPILSEELMEYEREYPPEWVTEAFASAANQNVRTWAYVKKILENRKNGVSKPKGNGKSQGAPIEEVYHQVWGESDPNNYERDRERPY